MDSLTWKFEDGSTIKYLINTKADKKALVRLLKGEKPQENVAPPSTIKAESLEQKVEVAPQQTISQQEVEKLAKKWGARVKSRHPKRRLDVKQERLSTLLKELVLTPEEEWEKLCGGFIVHDDASAYVQELWDFVEGVYREGHLLETFKEVESAYAAFNESKNVGWGYKVSLLYALGHKDIFELIDAEGNSLAETIKEMYTPDSWLYSTECLIQLEVNQLTKREIKTLFDNMRYYPNDYLEVPTETLKRVLKFWQTYYNRGLEFTIQLLDYPYPELFKDFYGGEYEQTVAKEKGLTREGYREILLKQANSASYRHQITKYCLILTRYYGHLDDELLNFLAGKMVSTQGEFPQMNLKQLKQAASKYPEFLEGCLRVSNLFKGAWQQWVIRNEKLGRSFHDATYWLPESMDADGVNYLNKWYNQPLENLELISLNWPDLTLEQRTMKCKELCSLLKVKDTYREITSLEFAEEAIKWGYSEHLYTQTEKIYLSALEIPVPFSPKEEFKVGNLVGRFLPRADVRVGFFGNYTNCCQHWHGVGKSCAVSSVKDIFSQLFVIEDNKGDIICGSWTWVNEQGQVCFDNVEAKGLGEREDACREIYYMASNWICSQGFVAVGTGTGLADLSFPDAISSVNWLLPSGYSGYTDANSISLLVMNPNPKPFKGLGSVYVRGMFESDYEDATQVAIACYPADHQHVSADENSTGLVLVVRGQLVGYAIYNINDSYVADIAVLPEYRRHSTKLVDKLLQNLKEIGGVWEADCRESTSLRLLEAYARRGRLQMEDLGASHSLSSNSGDQCHSVKFWFN